jgi:histidinol dehydrogenase
MKTLNLAQDPGALRSLLGRRVRLDEDVVARARLIIEAIENEGDAALLRHTREYDCPIIDSIGILVREKEIEAAYSTVTQDVLRALRLAGANIKRFHRRQLPKSWMLKTKGLRLEQRFQPLARVGIYVPGGKAAYPSTVLMNAIPAVIAGVKEIVMVTPCNKEGKITPEVLVAARESGVTEIYRIGGAQAVAALACGTVTIRAVDKITGPGNAYVAAAKQILFGRVGIDMIAGPTEIVIVADDSAPADYVAADLIAQAEHDQDASPVLITTSNAMAQAVESEVESQLKQAPREAIARVAFGRNGLIILVSGLDEAAETVNLIAPEHLEVMVKRPRRFARRISNAGAIFIGPWSSEALGDYVAGPNHTLPTSGTARFSSALSVYDFLKFTNVIECSRTRVAKLAPFAEALATIEGLHGHAASLRMRREDA